MSTKKIIYGITYTWIRFAIGFLTTFTQAPLFFKYLSKEEVGIWFLFFSAAAFIQMSDFGLPSAVARAVAYIKNTSCSEQAEVIFYKKYTIGDIYNSALTSFTILSLPMISIGITMLYVFKFGNGLTLFTSNDVVIAFTIFLIGILFNMTADIPNACLNGLGDVGYDSLLRIIIQTLGLITIWLSLPLYPSIKTLALIYLAQGILTTFIVNWFLKYKHKSLFANKGKVDLSLIRHLYRESLPLFINQIGSWLTNQSSIWIATAILGASKIADFSVLTQLIFYGLSISMSIPAAINPHAANAFSIGGINSLKKFFFLTLKLSSIIIGTWILILSVWGETIMTLWVGSGHYLGFYVLVPLLINLFFEMQHSISGGFVWNTGKWPFVPATLSAGILNMVFGILGCQYFGLPGLAIGTMLAKLLTLNWYVTFFALQRLKISKMDYIVNYFTPTIILLIIVLICSNFLNSKLILFESNLIFKNTPFNLIFSLVIGSIITTLIWIILYYFTVFSKSEKNSISIKLYNFIYARRH